MEPRALVNELKITHGISSDAIAKRVGCSKEYVDKMASGSRNNPSYRIVRASQLFWRRQGFRWFQQMTK